MPIYWIFYAINVQLNRDLTQTNQRSATVLKTLRIRSVCIIEFKSCEIRKVQRKQKIAKERTEVRERSHLWGEGETVRSEKDWFEPSLRYLTIVTEARDRKTQVWQLWTIDRDRINPKFAVELWTFLLVSNQRGSIHWNPRRSWSWKILIVFHMITIPSPFLTNVKELQSCLKNIFEVVSFFVIVFVVWENKTAWKKYYYARFEERLYSYVDMFALCLITNRICSGAWVIMSSSFLFSIFHSLEY